SARQRIPTTRPFVDDRQLVQGVIDEQLRCGAQRGIWADRLQGCPAGHVPCSGSPRHGERGTEARVGRRVRGSHARSSCSHSRASVPTSPRRCCTRPGPTLFLTQQLGAPPAIVGLIEGGGGGAPLDSSGLLRLAFGSTSA